MCLNAAPASALVLHDDGELPVDQRPVDALLGAWGTNASCVAIGPSHVLTTTHQGSSSLVIIGGVAYTAQTSTLLTGGLSGGADIRIAELFLDGEPANLPCWVDLYDGDPAGKLAVLGGYGKGRGTVLTTSSGVPYGYAWASSGNTTLRWGQNVLGSPSFDRLVTYFDGSDSAYAAPFEAAVAQFDSGGGWFIQDEVTGQWRLAGLTTGAEHALVSQSWFASSYSGAANPDRLEALDLRTQALWIEDRLASLVPTPGDGDRDGDVDIDDLSAFAAGYGVASDAGWSMGNYDGDGDVDLVDLGILAANYCAGSPAATDLQADLEKVGLVLEPLTSALVSLGVVGLLRRRR